MTKIKNVLAILLLATALSASPLVTVDGTAITKQDVDSALMVATQGRFNEVPADKQAEFRKQVLEQLIAKELIFNDAKKTGVLTSTAFKDEYAKVLDRVKKELAVQIWQKQQLDKVVISDKELKSYYDKNKAEFNEKGSVRARHILVKTEDEAKDIQKSLVSFNGDALKKKFIEEAKAKSTGPSGPNGGDLGYFAQGQMVPEFNDKVFSMKVGTVSQPVKTQFGYHLIYLEDKKGEKVRAFTEVKSAIQNRLKMEKFKLVMQQKMQDLKNNASIK